MPRIAWRLGVRARRCACRVLDVVVSAILMVLLLAAAARWSPLAIRLDSPRAGDLFRQHRLGRELRGRSRSTSSARCAHGAGADVHRAYVRADDPRATSPRTRTGGAATSWPRTIAVTRVGGFLRRSSLDELPQLWNVLRGEMSLVGPRPPIGYEVERVPAARLRAASRVKPGHHRPVAGQRPLAADASRRWSSSTSSTFERRSLWLNLKILVLTVPTRDPRRRRESGAASTSAFEGRDRGGDPLDLVGASIVGKIGSEQLSAARRSATGRLPGPRPRSA